MRTTSLSITEPPTNTVAFSGSSTVNNIRVPIVFIHRGTADYLPVSIAQAHYSNPDSPLYLLADDRWKNEPLVHHYSLDNESPSVKRFLSRYIHLSSNPAGFEQFCFMRWFHLREMMERENIEQVFVADSDALLYRNLNHLLPKWHGLKLGLSVPMQRHEWDLIASGHFSYWTQDSINAFCDFIFQLYDEPWLNTLRNKYAYHQAMGMTGGICDMTALYLFWHDYRARAGESATINLLESTSEGVFDLTLATGDNHRPGEFATEGIQKRVVWQNKQPYLVRTEGEYVPAIGLHFQGNHFKALLPEMATCPFNLRLNIKRMRNTVRYGLLPPLRRRVKAILKLFQGSGRRVPQEGAAS